MEDLYGYQVFPNPMKAFEAYVRITRAHSRQQLPDDWQESYQMGLGMLEYYYNFWRHGRDELKTLWVDGEPQVEVNFLVDVPFPVKEYFPDSPYDRVVYSGTIDRVTIDSDGLIWLVDYKTAKIMKSSHFANDPQVSAYCWAAHQLYNRPIGGMIYWQFAKMIPKPPEPMASGKISVNKQQRTSVKLYRHALIERYGSVQQAPAENVQFLNDLANRESETQDAFIRQDKIYKNAHSLEAEGTKILLEMEDMLNPNLPLYPNPNWMCPSMCPFYEPCVSMDDGSDWEQQLTDETQQRTDKDESWRKRLPDMIEAMSDEPAEVYKAFGTEALNLSHKSETEKELFS